MYDLQENRLPAEVRTTLTSTHAALPAVMGAVSAAGPTDLTVRPPSLEQLFMEHYQDAG